MTRRRFWILAAIITVAITVGVVVRAQVERYRDRQTRIELFSMLQPVALSNCQLERFGERNDGGYLMCGNLLAQVKAGYSYGISGYDKWGCDISEKLKVRVHQYDCFNLTQPACRGGDTVFHNECVGDVASTHEGRLFDTLMNQFAKNGDSAKRIVLKIDVEGAEWDSFLSAPDQVLEQIDQLAVEFHRVQDRKYIDAVRRLKQFFEVAHIHFNNVSCLDGLEPFPTWAYEVLFVNKRMAVIDPGRQAGGLHPLDAPNNPSLPECQPNARP
jgi:hypothetical protein